MRVGLHTMSRLEAESDAADDAKFAHVIDPWFSDHGYDLHADREFDL